MHDCHYLTPRRIASVRPTPRPALCPGRIRGPGMQVPLFNLKPCPRLPPLAFSQRLIQWRNGHIEGFTDFRQDEVAIVNIEAASKVTIFT